MGPRSFLCLKLKVSVPKVYIVLKVLCPYCIQRFVFYFKCFEMNHASPKYPNTYLALFVSLSVNNVVCMFY